MYIVHTLHFDVKSKYFVHSTTVHKKNSTVGTRVDFPEPPDMECLLPYCRAETDLISKNVRIWYVVGKRRLPDALSRYP
jgi:hypothetical protein